MSDPNFFEFSGPMSLAKIAEITSCEVRGDNADTYMINGVAALNIAGEGELSFLDNAKYRDQFRGTKAGACFVHPDLADEAPEGVLLLVTPSPYKAYAIAAQALYPDIFPESSISKLATIDDTASIGENCIIEAGVVIEAGVKLGDGCWIGANSVVGRNVELGKAVRIGSNVTLSHCIIGDHSRLYPGVRVGQDGFGFAIDPRGHVKVPQLGRVLIGEHVEVGANTTIDRGAGPDTIIGQGTWIDNLVQIGHNVQIGMGCIIVSQVGISGSTVIGDFVALGGQVGVAGHLKIGSGARIGAQAGVMRDVPAGEEQMGAPAVPARQFMKQVAFLKRLIKKNEGHS
jgi:UDP-3-O-[3-hydroxymyristoyl] glucosamine N-acyltransferase